MRSSTWLTPSLRNRTGKCFFAFIYFALAVIFVFLKKAKNPSDSPKRKSLSLENVESSPIKLGNTDTEGDAPEFMFPSVEERIEIYMGSWINSTFNESDLRPEYCDVGSPKEGGLLILGLKTLVQCVEGESGNMISDCNELLPMLVDTSANLLKPQRHNVMVLTRPGDGVKNINLPVVVKSRRVRDKSGLSNILLPFRTKSKLFDESNCLRSIPWEQKKDTLIWRGPVAGKRLSTVAKLYDFDVRDIDVALKRPGRNFDPMKRKKVEPFVRDELEISDMVKYKYLLSLEGTDIASALKWMMWSNSVVFMARPSTSTWFMEEKLKPFVHYVPLKDDFSDVEEMLQWARQHQKECQQISTQATEFINNVVMSKRAQRDNAEVLRAIRNMYQERFGTVLYDYCHDAKKGSMG